VKTDYDRTANFSQYKTFSWEAVNTRDQLNIDRIKNAVNADFGGERLGRRCLGGSICLVAIEATKNEQTLNTFYNGFGGGCECARRRQLTTYVDITKLGPGLDMFDSQSKKWCGGVRQ